MVSTLPATLLREHLDRAHRQTFDGFLADLAKSHQGTISIDNVYNSISEAKPVLQHHLNEWRAFFCINFGSEKERGRDSYFF